MRTLYLLAAALHVGACTPAAPPAVADAGAAVEPAAAPVRVVAQADASLAARPEVQAFIREMAARHGFDPNALSAVFGQAYTQPDIIAAITRPAEAKPWHAYRDIFLTPARISGGVEFWRTHAATLARAEQLHGVPAEIIVAIIGVETRYGGNTGRHRVLEALATLAFDYPKRADFFRKELEHYLLLTREEGIDPLALKGSYAGAMGLAQFMPSSYRAYAVDFDGDRRRDLWYNPEDAIGSVANYLSVHRWQPGGRVAMPAEVNGDQYRTVLDGDLKPSQSVQNLRRYGVAPQGPVEEQQSAILLELEGERGPEHWLGFYNFYVITRYNRSPLYAMAVYQLGQEIRRRYGV